MSVRRGLIRLWLLLAVVWGAGCVLYASRELPARLASSKHFELIQSERPVPVSCREAAGQKGADYIVDGSVCWFQMAAARRIFYMPADISDGEVIDRMSRRIPPYLLRNEKPAQLLVTYFGMAFGVPLGILAVGFALGWVCAGFKPQSSN